MTYYATLDWTYPEGSRTPLGFEVATYPSGGSYDSPTAKTQQVFSGYLKDADIIFCDLDTAGTFEDIALTGGYGANAVCDIVVTNTGGVFNISSITFPPHNGNLYRVGDELGGQVNGRWFYLRVTQLGFRVVYTTQSSATIKMAVRTVFPNGKSDWVESGVLTPV
jgi:hypothetical protein